MRINADNKTKFIDVGEPICHFTSVSEVIISDPEILSGMPVFRGTRLGTRLPMALQVGQPSHNQIEARVRAGFKRQHARFDAILQSQHAGLQAAHARRQRGEREAVYDRPQHDRDSGYPMAK
jgi:hypothetical protein